MILFWLPFQGIRDRLYQDPMEVQTPGQAFTAFLGALGFTRPVEQLELRSVPLPSLLFWLRRPKGINLVEATMPAGEAGSTSACRSMAIAVSEEMLYKDKCPLVGVGLVYTLPYVPRVQFSVAYMNLGAWRDATEESEDRLVGTRLMFIHASEASEFLPVAEEHPVLLDVCDTEVLGNIETCVPPLSLRGFKLHTVWILPPEGDRVRNIVSPRFEGGLASNLILYDEETVPPELGPQPPMRISLCASSQDHWTIALDTVFPSTLEEHRRIREQAASQPTEAGALPSSSSSTGDGGTEAAPTKERTLQMANSILDQVHALRLRSMRDLGRIRDLDRTLARTLMAEFSRVQLIVQEDMRQGLRALRNDLLASSTAFLADVRRIVDIPMAALGQPYSKPPREVPVAGRTEIRLATGRDGCGSRGRNDLLNARLQELSSETKLPDRIEETANLMDLHNTRVRELARNPDLNLSEVYSRVNVGLLAWQPIEANLFPGILEGLAGSLGLSPAGMINPPRSGQEGVMRRWATALRQVAYDSPDTVRDQPQAQLPWDSTSTTARSSGRVEQETSHQH